MWLSPLHEASLHVQTPAWMHLFTSLQTHNLCQDTELTFIPMLVPNWWLEDTELTFVPMLVPNRWLEDIRDWCVSRQLWWGHRIPAFYAVLDGEAGTPGSLDERLDQWLVAPDREAAEQLAQEKFPGRSFTLHQAWSCAGSSPFHLRL